MIHFVHRPVSGRACFPFFIEPTPMNRLRLILACLSIFAVATVGHTTTGNPAYNYDTTQDLLLYYDDAANVLLYLNSGNSTDVDALYAAAEAAALLSDPNATAMLQLAIDADACDVNNSGMVTSLDALLVINLLSDDPFTNPVNQFDIDESGVVEILDLLIGINEFNSRTQTETFLEASTACQEPYFDVNGNIQFTATDLFDLIDALP